MTPLQGAETVAALRFLMAKLDAALTPKVYPAVAPHGTAMPYVLVQNFPRPGGGDVNTVEGTRIMARLRYLIKVVHSSLEATEPLVKAVEAAIIGQEGVQNGYFIFGITRQEPYEEPLIEGEEIYWQAGGFYEVEVSGT